MALLQRCWLLGSWPRPPRAALRGERRRQPGRPVQQGGPGITQSELLVINKTDLAPQVGADLSVMARDARRMRGEGPVVFAQCTHGVGVAEVAGAVLAARAAVLVG